MSPSMRLLFKMDNKLSVQKGHFQRRGRAGVRLTVAPASNCSECNGKLLQHLRPSHIFKASIPDTKPLATLAFLSSLTKPSLCLLFAIWWGAISSAKPIERGAHRIKQTNTKLHEAMLNRVTHGFLFIFSIVVQEGSTLESKSSPASSLRGLVSVATSQGNFLSCSDTLFN